MLALNTIDGLIPVYGSDLDSKRRLKIGTEYWVEVKEARNPEFHKKLFALFKLGCENSQNVEMPLDSYRKYITCKAGFYKAYNTPKGMYFEADSLSYGNMNQEQIEEVYKKVLDVIIEDTGADKVFIERELAGFL